MKKLLAVVNVVAWGGFWAFGYLAFSNREDHSDHLTLAIVLALLGAVVGIWAYSQLVRHAKETGYGGPTRRAVPEHLREQQEDAKGETD